MLRKLLRYLLSGLILLLVFLSSALLAMRFAIHGREVPVPSLIGLGTAEAERLANANGLVLSVESRFYVSDVPAGRIVSQVPAPETSVRRGWKILVAESLGSQRAAIPNLIGQSQHAADLNMSRHGLETGSIARLRIPGVPPDTVVTQSPPPAGKDATTPVVNLVLSASDNAQRYVMPSFVGQTLVEASDALHASGFRVGKIRRVGPPPVQQNLNGRPEIIVKQEPQAGQKVAAGAAINFEVQP